MKLNINLMKVIIKLSVLLIIVVMFFIISVFLYSAKYWPDVYNYFNANITIKRIPKISEIEVTIYETTEIENARTTDRNEFKDMTTLDYGDNDYFSLDEVEHGRRKRRRESELRETRIEDAANYNELPTRDVIVDSNFYVDPEINLFHDLVDENKLTTRNIGDVEIISGVFNDHGYLRISEEERKG